MHRSVSQLITSALLFQEAQILFDFLKVDFDRPTQRVDFQDFGVAQRAVSAQEDDPVWSKNLVVDGLDLRSREDVGSGKQSSIKLRTNLRPQTTGQGSSATERGALSYAAEPAVGRSVRQAQVAAGALCRFAVIELQKSTKPLGFGDGSSFALEPFIWEGDYIIQTLVISFPLMVRQIFSDHIGQRALAKENQVLQALAADGANPAFGVSI
jgi:hypothetical protein